VEAENIGKTYGNLNVLENIDLLIERGSKIAFVGQNGQGKSTLAKIMVGEISHTGSLKLGHNVQIGYFAQNQAEYLDGEKTVLDTMIDAANEKTRSKVRDMLGSFLFRGDEVSKKVKVLSGGERNRLALCKLLLQPFNVLIMDEPTNHLDIKSKNVLKEALNSFEGTLILVSHDRDFLQNLTSTVYEFKDKRIREYLGDIDYYLEQRNVENMRAIEKRDKIAKEDNKNSSSKQAYNDQKKFKSINNKLSNTEAKIGKLEKELKERDAEMAANYKKALGKPHFLDNYKKKKKELESLMKSWEQLQEELEQMA
jgi:ATP-binding cassette subfamily F protein 3